MKFLNKLSIKNKKQYILVWSIFFLCIYAIRIYQGRYITALCEPPIKGIGLNLSFWLVNITGIPCFIIKHKIFVIFIDFAIPILTFFILLFNKKRIFSILFFIFFLLQHFTLETYSVTHTKGSVFILLSTLPLLVQTKNFNLMVEFAKYFCCFVFCIAAYYKISHGVAFELSHFSKVLQLQHIDLLYYNKENLTLNATKFLINHKVLSFILFSILIIIQYSFIIAFFTNKYNKILFVLFLLFNIASLFLMRIYSYEILMCVSLSFLYQPHKILSNK